MQNMAERLAENSHDIWAKKKKEELIACGNYLFFCFMNHFYNKTHYCLTYITQTKIIIRPKSA